MKARDILHTALIAGALLFCAGAGADEAPRFELDKSWPRIPEK